MSKLSEEDPIGGCRGMCCAGVIISAALVLCALLWLVAR